MAIRSSDFFTYNNIPSTDFGIYNVNIESGLLEETFLPTREVKEIVIPGRDKPYFQRVDAQPLSIRASFYFDGGWDENKIRQVSRWLFQDYYKPLSFSDNPDRIFYAVVDSDSSLIHNGLSEGYVTLSFRCDSPYAYSPVYITEIFDLTSTTSLQLTNEGDANLYPEIWIQTTVAGDVTITNLTNGGAVTQFSDLASNETVYLNCETEDIATDIAGLYRYDNFNNIPLVLVPGINNLTITGKVKAQFRYQYKVLQG